MDDRDQTRPRRWLLPVTHNEHLGGPYWRMGLAAPELLAQMRAGQFVSVRCADGYDPLLRRPFSVYRLDRSRGVLWLLYEVAGRGTAMIARWQPGTLADLLAPLGNGFGSPPGDGPLALVAGGIGVAPLVALAEEVASTGRALHAFLGARTADRILGEADLRALGAWVEVSTDDGSRGHHGLVHQRLQALLEQGHRYEAIYACGPRPMMAAVSQLAQQANIPCFVSMEEVMACGFGVCMGCACRVRSETVSYRLVCTDGPIFNAEQILWEAP